MSTRFGAASDYSNAAVWVIHREKRRFDLDHWTFRQAASPSPPHGGGNRHDTKIRAKTGHFVLF